MKKINLFKGPIFKGLITCLIIASFIIATGPVFAANGGPTLNTLTIDPSNSPYTVSNTTTLNELIIKPGGVLTAPYGYSLTLTVNGVEMGQKLIPNASPPDNFAVNPQFIPGTYRGNIVLTVTKNININGGGGPGGNSEYSYRTGIYIEDGKYVPDQSVAAAVIGGKVNNKAANNVRITSLGEDFNGIMVTSSGTESGAGGTFTGAPYSYIINSPKIDFTGNGGNDFAGFGAAIMSSGNADVTVNHANIVTNGAVRTAIWAGGNSTMNVNNSYIRTHEGTLPSEYVDFWPADGSPPPGGPQTSGIMLDVPWMLGITGNCRATNLLGNATANYTNDTIIADCWGGLSTDQTTNVKLTATNCLVKVIKSGYGSYAIGTDTNTFNKCTFDVPDYGLIMANGGATAIYNGTKVNSGRFGVMMHSGNAGTLTINNGSEFNTANAVIQVKSSEPTINIDHAKLNSKIGIILESVENDDPFAGGPGTPNPPYPVNANFSNTTLNGDIINSDTTQGDVNATFDNTTITGAITTATQTPVGTYPRDGYTAADIADVGNFDFTYCNPGNTYGMNVTLNGHSRWVVSKTSYLTSLSVSPKATVTAPSGYHVTMKVDGTSIPIVPGNTYTGAIVLTVTAN